jgi:rod shape-determining protein MreC
MPPSANRRSGNSRRAQYKTFLSFLLGGMGAVVGAALLILSFFNPDAFVWLRGLGSDATAPASRTMAAGKAEGRGMAETLGGFFTYGSENARMKREIALAKVRLVEAEATAEENRRLKALLGLMQTDPKPVAASRLIGSTGSSTRRFATIDVGSMDGISVGMPVRSQLGVVGRVLEVFRDTSRVLLITDSESVVPVRRAKDDVAGFAQGKADGTLQIRLINLGINPLRKGDTLVTSGSGGLYRPGVPIAVVMHVTSDGAIARVLSDPGATDYVVVDPVWAQEAPPELPPAASAGAALGKH